MRDFESKEAILNTRADVFGECLRFFRSAPDDNPYRFLVIKSSHFSLNSEYCQRSLLYTAEEIAAVKKAAEEKAYKEISAIKKAAFKARRMIFIICTSKQLLPKTTSEDKKTE